MEFKKNTDVDARYGEVRVLHGVSLSVEDGDFVAVLGANGAGKTTTLRAISGTVKTTGDVFFEGEKLFRRTPEAMARRGVAHVPEGRACVHDAVGARQPAPRRVGAARHLAP